MTTRQVKKAINEAASHTDDPRCSTPGCGHKVSYHNEKGCYFIGCQCKEFAIDG